MILDEQQLAVVNATESKIAVIAAAGSGKTACITERIRHLSMLTNPANIVAITFTNMAADEMRERLHGEAEGAFIGTIHSYANKLLSAKGYDTSKALKNEKFDSLFTMINNHKEVIEPVEYLLIDEFQDVSNSQFEFFRQINPKNFFIVGDDWQNIFSWRDANSNLFKSLVDDPAYKVYRLENNYRSGSEIINFAGRQLGTQPLIPKTVRCARDTKGTLMFANGNYSMAAEYLKAQPDRKDWFVLCRTNRIVDSVIASLNRCGVPAATFKKADLSKKELQQLLDSDMVKVLTIHSAKGLESKNVLVWSFTYTNDEEARLGYVAATRAKDKLVWCTPQNKRYNKKTY